ncbi:MAG: amidophosphoribosyltransferase [Nitrospinae bacterium]|nr:amidophosphoribosyltransferase [Nitrospinota bacterium]
MEQKFHDQCAVFGVYGHAEAANLTYLGLYALQHRGQESSGIVTSDGVTHSIELGMGLVQDIFSPSRIAGLKGNMAIGHNRYSTSGESLLKNAQPLAVDFALGSMAIAHNGNLVNAGLLKDALEAGGSIFRSTMDTEVITHLIATAKSGNFVSRVAEALNQVHGAYSLLLMTEDEIVAVRDPHGFRPLSMGRLDGAYVFASETCAFDLIGAEYVRDIEPGEMVVVSPEGIESFHPFPKKNPAHCVFEFIYFARPDSTVFGDTVYNKRKRMGMELAKEHPVDADLVIAVPDSGVPAALGYAEESQIKYELGLIRNHYIGRTFIEPSQQIRHFGVKIKLNPIRSLIKGKKVIVVDDSIVRGTTCRKIVEMIRNAGAKEVHMRISSPPTTNPCFYGIDTPTKGELIASSKSIEEIRAYLGCETLAYIGMDRMLDIFGPNRNDFCTACFSGNYPVVTPGMNIFQPDLFELAR